MRLPTQLSRNNPNVHKNNFGHVLILAGSPRMLGAAALSGLAAMRAGAGMVTIGIPASLNSVIQKKISNTIMTWPLPETKVQTISFSAFKKIKESYSHYSSIALGPGLSLEKSTQKFIFKIIETSPVPLVIDADAITTVSKNLDILQRTKTHKILTPHPGEMSRLTNIKKSFIEENRKDISTTFAKKNNCTLLLKGHHTVVSSSSGEVYVNKTGNAGMATAGSGDVLTGIIASFLSQKLSAFDSAKYGAYLHGKAGDIAEKTLGKISLIATDIIDQVPTVLKSSK